ncbi:MAG: hypothetical protein O3C60_17140 [Planctomycetota bacterium]|nr:hypothetical protein [Planctomycetota bacterium]
MSKKQMQQSCLVLALFVFPIGGCGLFSSEAIHGNVALDGEPIIQGSIAFIPTGTTRGASAGCEIVDGAYRLAANAPPLEGQYKVEIRSARPTGRKIPEPPPAPRGTTMDEFQESVPAMYNANTILTVEITKATRQFDFLELKSKP